MSTNKKGLATITEGLPPTYWLIWTGTLVNRVGGFVIPFLTLYLTVQRAIPVSRAALIVSLYGAGSFISQLTGGELTEKVTSVTGLVIVGGRGAQLQPSGRLPTQLARAI